MRVCVEGREGERGNSFYGNLRILSGMLRNVHISVALSCSKLAIISN